MILLKQLPITCFYIQLLSYFSTKRSWILKRLITNWKIISRINVISLRSVMRAFILERTKLKCIVFTNTRSRRLQMFFKIGTLKNFAVITRKHLCRSLFLNELQAWRPRKRYRIQHRCFPVNNAKVLGTVFFTVAASIINKK